MRVWQALLLGVVQGATEFLPVSSSGHLVLVPWILGWEGTAVSFAAVVHLGTLVAAILIMRGDLVELAAGLWRFALTGKPNTGARLALLLALATLPGAIGGLLLEDTIDATFARPPLVAVFLLVTGAVLWLAQAKRGQGLEIWQLTLAGAVGIGVAQLGAIVPGLSRSGLTMAAGLCCGLSPVAAVRFSFLLSLPIIAGAGLFEVAHMVANPPELRLVLAAAVLAAAVGGASMKALLRLAQSKGLRPFAYYCFCFGGLCLLLALARA